MHGKEGGQGKPPNAAKLMIIHYILQNTTAYVYLNKTQW